MTLARQHSCNLFYSAFQPIEQKQLLYVKRHQRIKMQFNNYGIMSSGLFGLVLILVATFEPAAAFGPITLTLGTTAVVLTGTQVAIGVAALAGLAIAKEKIAIAEISRRNRG